jgi:cation transport ATPase
MNGEPIKPKVVLGEAGVRVEDARIFADPDSRAARLFARRVLALPEVRSLSLAPAEGAAEIQFQVPGRERRAFLGRLAAAVGGQGSALEEGGLPAWRPGAAVTLHSQRGLVSTFEILGAGRGKLQLRHPTIVADPAFALAAEESLRALPGVKDASATRSSGKLWVAYDPRALGLADILRAAERPAARAQAGVPVPQAKPVDMGSANAMVGLATVGELALPLATPLCAGVLVVTHLGVLREAARQVSQGKFGTPVWTTALLACSIASGQVLAYALTDWSFRYWARRWRKEVAAQSRVLLQEAASMPGQARLLSAEGAEVMTSAERLRPGQALIVAAGEGIPVDGRVVSGSALVQETPFSGAPASVRKVPGDEVYAGSTIVAGAVRIEVLRAGQETRAARIAQAMFSTVAALPGDPLLTQRSVALVDRTVPPTLATAGVGLAVGDLFTVGAILHQDWLSGADLAVPMETLRDIRLAAGRGALVRNPSALQRLAESRFVVLEDQPALRLPALELGAMRSRVPDAEALLQHVAGAGLYLGDERAAALVAACGERGLVLRQPELLAMDAERVTVLDGRHRIALRGEAPEAGQPAYLEVEVDGAQVAVFEFRPAPRMRAAQAVGRLRRQGIQVFLVSERPEAETAALAQALGVELYSGDLSPERKVAFLRGLRRRGVLPAWVGHGRTGPAVKELAHVSVSMASGLGFEDEAADILLLGESLEPLADIAALSAENRERIVKACRTATLPNLLCVVGAFAGLLNGITAGILANIAVYRVYRSATASLRTARAQRPPVGKIVI